MENTLFTHIELLQDDPSPPDDDNQDYLPPSQRWVKYFILSYSILLLSLCIIVNFLMCKRRNMQPLKKRSPILLLVSSMGNWLC